MSSSLSARAVVGGSGSGSGSKRLKEFADLCDELSGMQRTVFHALLTRLFSQLGKRLFLRLYNQPERFSAAVDLLMWADGVDERVQALKQALIHLDVVEAFEFGDGTAEGDKSDKSDKSGVVAGVEQQHIWNLPPFGANVLFVGRRATRARLEQALVGCGGDKTAEAALHAQSLGQEGPTNSRTPRRGTVTVAVLSGMGGVGKTMLAARYALDCRERYGILWWINAESSSSAETGLAQLGRRLGVCSEGEAATAAAAKALRALASRATMWLLVYDNADDPDVLKNLIPTNEVMNAEGVGHVVVTSRVQGDRSVNVHLPVGVFDRTESVELLRELTVLQPVSVSEASALGKFQVVSASSTVGSEDESESADSCVFDVESAGKVAALVEDLPLALAQAGSYVAQTMISLGEYAQLYHKRWLELVKDDVHNVRPGHYAKTVLTTWEVSMGKVGGPHSDAGELLRFCSLIAADDIPQRLMVRFIADGLSKDMDRARLAACRAIAALRKYSLICGMGRRRVVGGAVQPEGVHIHRVLQAVVRADVFGAIGKSKDEEETSAANGSAMLTLLRALVAVRQEFGFAHRDVSTWASALQIAPHGKELVEHTHTWISAGEQLSHAALKTDPSFQNLVCAVLDVADVTCRVLREAGGDYGSSKSTAQAGVDLSRAALKEEHPHVAGSYENLGDVYSAMGNYAKSAGLYEKALKIRRSALGEEHPDVATCYNNLGAVHNSMGEYSKAAELYEKALKIRKSALGEEHPDVATCYNNLGIVHRVTGEYAKAAELHEKALKIRKSALGEDHPDVATSYNNLGGVHDSMGEYSKAAELYEKALKIRKSALGEEHPDVATCYNNLGIVHRVTGEYAKAAELYEKALKIRRSALGEEHRQVAASYNNLGSVHDSMGEYAKAAELYEKALKISRSALGEEHPHVATSYDNLGIVHRVTGEYAKAAELHEKALKIRRSALGEELPDVAASYNSLGAVRYCMGEYAKAAELYENALKIRRSALGEEHPDVAASYNNLRAVQYSMGEYAKAAELHEKALKIRRSALGEDHPDVAMSYNNLGGVYYRRREYSKAAELYGTAVAIYEKRLGRKHARTRAAQMWLGRAVEMCAADSKLS